MPELIEYDIPEVVDHIQARFMGGSNDFQNLQLLCQSCNLRKGLLTIDYRPDKRNVT